MSELRERHFATRQELDEALGSKLAGIVAEAVAERGEASLVVSGGSTPRGLFQRLAAMELPWSKVTVLLADERWLDRTHADSNEKLIREQLLVKRASAARLIPLKTRHGDASDAVAELDRKLAAFGPFDLVLLGMGADGHFASLFPGTAELAQGLDLQSGRQCIAMTPATAPWPRLSMTLPRLLHSKRVILHITGAEKRSVLEQAKRGEAAEALPVSALLQQDAVPLTVYWAP